MNWKKFIQQAALLIQTEAEAQLDDAARLQAKENPAHHHAATASRVLRSLAHVAMELSKAIPD